MYCDHVLVIMETLQATVALQKFVHTRQSEVLDNISRIMIAIAIYQIIILKTSNNDSV